MDTLNDKLFCRLIAFILAFVMFLGNIPMPVNAADAKEDHIRQENFNTSISLRYDDRYNIAGKTVEIVDAGKPTSYQVGYGVEENKVLDTAVVTLKGDALIATGIGTAQVRIDGQLREVTVTAAPISLLLLAGQSNMQGIDGNGAQSIACPDGQVYATYADRWMKTVEDVSRFAPSALSGQYRTVNVTGTTEDLSNYPVYMLTEEGNGREGMDSGIAYEWNRQTGEKVWVVNMGYGGSSINAWQKGGTHYNNTLTVFSHCTETLRKEISAGHYTLSHMGYFWCQGCADENQTPQWYEAKYQAMHKAFKEELAFDHDSDPTTPDASFEFAGIIPIRSGHQGAGSYRAGTYTQTTSASYYTSFKDLRMNGPRVAQYWMGNNPELTDIGNVCTIQETWATMPDGSDGVSEYFNDAYTNGTVDYEPQVAQSASWYKPTTPAAVHDNIHYNQIGYNEIGRESARNALINLGEMEAPETEASVKFVIWDGFSPAETVATAGTGNTDTLVVPMVSPVYLSKTVSYSVSEGLNYSWYDLTAQRPDATGTLKASVGDTIVTAVPRAFSSYRWSFDGSGLKGQSDEGFTVNEITKAGGTFADGVFNNQYYYMSQTAMLCHDKAWSVEWVTDKWNTTQGSMILSSGTSTGGTYIYQRATDYFVGIGYNDNGAYHNYGISLKPLGLLLQDGEEHSFRIENRIAADSSNQICLIVDGTDYGPLADHYINSELVDNNTDWLTGRDFAFSALGSSDFPLRGLVLQQLTVNETGENILWEQGTIASINGQNNATTSRLRTVSYMKLSEFTGVGIGLGYTMTNFVYDAQYNYLGTSSWIGNGMSFTTAALQEQYPDGVYFRVALRALDQRTLTTADIPDIGVKFYAPGETIPQPESSLKYTDVGTVGSWQDGAIYDGKLFVFGGAGTGAVYDLDSLEKLGTVTLDKKDILKPHANSVCFGNTYYAAGDKYPLLYVNIYNNYAAAEDRMEGTCCVYRVMESDGQYSTNLVQVIRVGFTEDLTLWKSKENNGDVRPYGNFVVDTDRDKLYAFVMRDAEKTTRFFGFDLPELTEGTPHDAYGCNVVTLQSTDIETQFDTAYFNYLQGCCYYDGRIISVEGFNSGSSAEPGLRIIDLDLEKETGTFYPATAGLTKEPEVVCVDPDSGTLYYAAADGVLRIVTLENVHFHTYQTSITPPTCTEQGYTTYTCECGDSYVDDYADALGHNYTNGICVVCGYHANESGLIHAIPENDGVKNAIDRAYALTDVLWTPLADVPGVHEINGEYFVIPFEAGVTYKGIPYSGVTANDCYVGLNVSLEAFLTALENGNSVLYTENLNSTNPKSATYFGTVCSKFAQYVLDIPGSYNTNNVANIPGMETIAMPGTYTVDQIKLGDVVLNTATHTTVCTDILYDTDGNVAYIEIAEAVMPLVRRMLWSPEEFYEHFADYRLCRYQHIDEVPAANAVNVDGHYALMPRFGDKYNYRVSSTKGVVDVLDSGYYKAVVLRDGVIADEIILNGATSFSFDRSIPGYLEMYLEKEDGSRSSSVYACVVKSSVSVTDSSEFGLGKLTVNIDGSCGTPLYVQVGSAHAIFCNVEGCDGTAELAFSTSKISTQQVRVAYQNEYGIYLSSWVPFTAETNPSNDPLLSQGEYWNGYNITPNNPTPVIQENKEGYWSYTMVPVEENTLYYSEGATRMWFLDENGNGISSYNAYKDGEIPFQFTTPAKTAYVSVAYSPDLVEKGTETLKHVHRYQLAITAPTCTEQGYTTYICGCGDQYVADYVDATGHSFGEWKVTKAPTCTEKGTETRTCSCGHSESREVSATGHKYSSKVTVPTCTEQGYTTYTCGCGDKYVSDYVDAKGHSFGEWKVTKAPTCTEKGTETRTCACGHSESREMSATGHKYTAEVTEPTCTEKGYTTYSCGCGDQYVADYVDATGHSFGVWKVAKAPTCTEMGTETRTCSCGHSESREVSATGHNYTAEVIEPTCTEKGYTMYTCACGDKYVADYVDATGHSFGEWKVTKTPTCTEKGSETRTCGCGHSESREVKPTGHKYTSMSTAPTCTEQGYTTYTCACGDKYISDYVDSKGHSFGEWKVTKASTCTEKGTETQTCACGHSESKEVSATGHKYSSKVTVPTCTEKGYTTYTCACGDKYVSDYVDAKGHSFGEWKITKAPTCTEKGSETRTCSCGHSESREVSATGHKYTAEVTEPTCTEDGYTTYTCACGDKYASDYVDPKGHSFGEWKVTKTPTCTEKGSETRTCGCGHSESREVSSTGHKYTAEVTEPTCTEKGFTTYICSCGDKYVADYVDAKGHVYVDGQCSCGQRQYRLGDSNGDGVVNNIDAMRILQCFVGLLDRSEIIADVCDVDGDGRITNIDAMWVLQAFVGLREL